MIPEFFELPNSPNIEKVIAEDLAVAEEVIIVSPYVSTNVVKEWRSQTKHLDKKCFTIVYGCNNDQDEKFLYGTYNEKLFQQCTWKRMESLHSKIFFIRSKYKFSFYYGSANFTNQGIGGPNVDMEHRNVELVSRVTGDHSEMETFLSIIAPYVEAEDWFPTKEEVTTEKVQVDVPEDSTNGIVQEYRKILSRKKDGQMYRVAGRKSIANNPILKKGTRFLGFFRSASGIVMKMHTSNLVSSGRIYFSLDETELEWFLGGFEKKNCKGTQRRIVLVWKKDGYWNGELYFIELYPMDLFELFSKSSRQKKLKVKTDSVSISLVIKNKEVFLVRRNKELQVNEKRIQKELSTVVVPALA